MKKGNESILDKASKYAKEREKAIEQAELTYRQQMLSLLAPFLQPVQDRLNAPRVNPDDPEERKAFAKAGIDSIVRFLLAGIRALIQDPIFLPFHEIKKICKSFKEPTVDQVRLTQAAETLTARIRDICKREPVSEVELVSALDNIMKKYAGHNSFLLHPKAWNLVKVLSVIVRGCSNHMSLEVVKEARSYFKEMGISQTRLRLGLFDKSPWFNKMLTELIETFKPLTHPETCIDADCQQTHREAYELTSLVVSIFYPGIKFSIDALKKKRKK